MDVFVVTSKVHTKHVSFASFLQIKMQIKFSNMMKLHNKLIKIIT